MIDLDNMLQIWLSAIGRASWQGGLAALAAWIVCRIITVIPLRFQCWLWRLVMLKFLIAFVWSIPIEVPLLPASAPTASSAIELFSPVALPSNIARSDAIESRYLRQLLLFAFVSWVVFVLWQLLRLLVAWCETRRYTNGCRQSENRQLLDVAEGCSTLLGLSKPPRVLESMGHGSPLLVGILRPAIVLPTTTLKRLNVSEQWLVLSHEQAHVVRGDLLFKLIARIVRGLFFFHPLAWLSERQLNVTQEMAADELAIEVQKQDPIQYASLLVSVISKLGRNRRVPMMSVGTVGSKNSLKQRLFAMRFMKPVSPRSAFFYSLAMGLIAISSLVPWTFVEATASAAEQAGTKETNVGGKFISFKDGVLRVRGQEIGSELPKEYEWKVVEGTKILSHLRKGPQEGTSPDAFKHWEPEAIIAVKLIDKKVTFIELGINKAADRVPDRVPEKTADKAGQKAKMERGKFVSFKDGVVTIKTNANALVENKIPENAKILVWDIDEGKYKSAGSLAFLKDVKVGTWMFVNLANENATVYIGARKGSTTGTYISFKDGRLLILGKDLGESFTKKYGNNVHFQKFRDDVLAYESVDGGEYQLIGNANKVLSKVKEGTIVIVHGEGDDNITFVEIGVANKK